MEPYLVGPWARLGRKKEEMVRRVAAWAPADREWRPGEASWSLADVVEHCVLVEGGLRTALAREPTSDRPRVVKPGRWLRWPIMRAVLKWGIRIRAPVDAILPKRDLAWDPLIAKWDRERMELERWLEGSDRAIHADPRFRHPIAGWLDVPQAVTFAADHLEHHLQQVGRIEKGLSQRGV